MTAFRNCQRRLGRAVSLHHKKGVDVECNPGTHAKTRSLGHNTIPMQIPCYLRIDAVAKTDPGLTCHVPDRKTDTTIDHSIRMRNIRIT